MKVQDIIDKRKGKINFSLNTLEGIDLKACQKIFKDLIIINAKHNTEMNEINYKAISKKFRKLEKGEKVPYYAIQVNVNFGDDKEDYTIEFIEMKNLKCDDMFNMPTY